MRYGAGSSAPLGSNCVLHGPHLTPVGLWIGHMPLCCFYFGTLSSSGGGVSAARIHVAVDGKDLLCQRGFRLRLTQRIGQPWGGASGNDRNGEFPVAIGG